MNPVLIPDTDPEGFEMPLAALRLFACAESNGWGAAGWWNENPRPDGAVLTVVMYRGSGTQELYAYSVMWGHMPGSPGKLHPIPHTLASTPDNRDIHDGPTLRGLLELMRGNPISHTS